MKSRSWPCREDRFCAPGSPGIQKRRAASSHYGQLGWSGTALFKWFESGVRRLQSELHLPYLALFDSYRMGEAGSINLKGVDLIHERYNLMALGGVRASQKLGIPLVLEVNADLLQQRKFKGIPERGLRRLFAVWATRISFNAAAKIICISVGLKDHLSRKWNIEEEQANRPSMRSRCGSLRAEP